MKKDLKKISAFGVIMYLVLSSMLVISIVLTVIRTKKKIGFELIDEYLTDSLETNENALDKYINFIENKITSSVNDGFGPITEEVIDKLNDENSSERKLLEDRVNSNYFDYFLIRYNNKKIVINKTSSNIANINKSGITKVGDNYYLATYGANENSEIITLTNFKYIETSYFLSLSTEYNCLLALTNDKNNITYDNIIATNNTIEVDFNKIFYLEGNYKNKPKTYDYYGKVIDTNYDSIYLVYIADTLKFEKMIAPYTQSNRGLALSFEVIVTLLITGLFVFVRRISLFREYELNQKHQSYMARMFDNFEECFLIYNAVDREIEFASDNVISILGYPKDYVLAKGEILTIEGNNFIEEIKKLVIGDDNQLPTMTMRIHNELKKNVVTLKISVKIVNYNGQRCYGIIIGDITKDFEQKLLLSNKLAEAKEEYDHMQTFLSKVSHELRTPLNGVIGMNMIAMEALNESNYQKTFEALKNVERSGSYLLQVINNVLDLAKIEKGQMNIKNEVFSLNEVLDEIPNMVNSQLEQKHIKLEVKYDFIDLAISTDKLKLTQIIINLVSNAIKYGRDNGFIRLYTQTKSLPQSKVSITINVEDNGIGMSDDFIQKLFTPYAQENRQTKYASSGLGLVITKNLVSLLNGKISVNSKYDIGSNFKLEFVFDQVISENTKPAETINFDFNGLNVLVAEDNAINSVICENHLKKYGIKTTFAINGNEVCKAFYNSKEFEYDLILMDIKMPLCDGYDAAKRIRESTRLDKNIPIIAMTADAFQDDINKAFLFGMNGHIAKPLVVHEMMSTIANVMSKKEKKNKKSY